MAAPTSRAGLAQVEQAVLAVPDPEIPVLTIADLGIVREVEATGSADDGAPRVTVRITPTYSGCPAIEAIAASVADAAARLGWRAHVETVLSPAWTTDWMSAEGRERLRRYGIAPPGRVDAGAPVGVALQRRQVDCPSCGSPETEELSRFGATACKSLRRCRACREPFEEFKTL